MFTVSVWVVYFFNSSGCIGSILLLVAVVYDVFVLVFLCFIVASVVDALLVILLLSLSKFLLFLYSC